MSERTGAISHDQITTTAKNKTTATAATSTTSTSGSSNSESSIISNLNCLIKTLTESIKILYKKKRSFIPILTLLSLPLSLLLHALSLSSLPVETQSLSIYALFSLAPNRSESRELWRESRELSLSLLRRKLLFFLPIAALSLLTTLTSVSLTHSVYTRKPLTAFASVKSSWLSLLITWIHCYVLLLLYSFIINVFSGLVFTSPGLTLVVRVVGFGLEVYVMGVMCMSMVASVVEKPRIVGLGAVRFAWNVMQGRRVCGWVVSGLLVVMTWWVWWRMERGVVVVDAGDLSEFNAVVVARWWERWGIVALYGVVVVWGCVVFTVFYSECRKRHVVREHEEVELDEERALTSIDG